jgi:PST family polysaccharide transporter
VNVYWLKVIPPVLRRRLERRPRLVNAISNTGWLLGDKAVRFGFGVFVTVWMARYLGPENFGLYSYAVALGALFSVVATLGLDGIVVRELVRVPAIRVEILGTAFALRLVAGTVMMLVALSTVVFLRPKDTVSHWLVGIITAGAIFQAADVIDYWFQSEVRSKYVVIARSAAFLSASALKVCLILGGASLIAFGWATLSETTIAAVGLVTAYWLAGQQLSNWRFLAARARSLLRDSWPLMLSGAAIMVYVKIDQVMLGQIVGGKAVGIYSAAARISEVWYLVPMAIVASVSPSIIAAREVSEDLFYRRIATLFQTVTALSLVIALVMSVMASHITLLLYGSEYATAGQVLAIHIWAVPFVFLGVAQGPWTLSENMTRHALMRTVLGALTNVCLNSWLIPKQGVIGAAIATVISQALASVLLNAVTHETRRIFYMQTKALLLWSSWQR